MKRGTEKHKIQWENGCTGQGGHQKICLWWNCMRWRGKGYNKTLLSLHKLRLSRKQANDDESNKTVSYNFIIDVQSKWTRNYTQISELQLLGYYTYHNLLAENKHCFIIIYIWHVTEATPIALKSSFEECIWLSVNLNLVDRLIFNCVFRSPSS